MRAYTLRDPYKDTFVGGHINAGDGHAADLRKLLDDGNGEIRTNDTVFQSALESYHGTDGLMFDVVEIQGEGGEEQRVPVVPVSEMGPPIALPKQPEVREPSAGTVAAMPQAQHGNQSEYLTMPINELRDEVNSRGLSVEGGADRADEAKLAEALEADDAARDITQR